MALDPDRLRTLFLDELEEHTRRLDEGLDDLDRDPAAATSLVTELFRAAHSVKGAAQVADVTAAARLGHDLEELLAAVRDGERDPDRDVRAELRAGVDALAILAARLRAGRDPGDATAHDSAAHDSAAQAPAPATAPPSATAGSEHTPRVRLSAERVGALLDRVGEVMLASERVEQLSRDVAAVTSAAAAHDRRWRHARAAVADEALAPQGRAALEAADLAWTELSDRLEAMTGAPAAQRELRRAVASLEGVARSARMQPFTHACEGLGRAVRGIEGKRATLVVAGGETTLDREIVAALREPLLHLVRNAVDHGIEPESARRRAGKPPEGTVTVTARTQGDRVEITVADDGAGIDEQAVLAAGERRGQRGWEATRLAFSPGVSTTPAVTDVSGRGVGLDAVRARVEELGGSVALDSQSGRGCVVTLEVPTSLTGVHALLARVADQIVALPSAGVDRVVRVADSDIAVTGGQRTVAVDGSRLPLIGLSALFDGDTPPPAAAHRPAVVVRAAGMQVALLVDALVDARVVTVRPLGERLAGAPAALGATLLTSGELAIVASPAACARLGLERAAPGDTSSRTAPPRRPRVLLAEDTLATRTLEQGILEAAGYDVLAAADGEQAWRLLCEHSADVVVSDVDMPAVDGIELCERIRSSPQHADLPVVLVTALASESDRRRGVDAGANAYLVKAEFTADRLLATIERFL